MSDLLFLNELIQPERTIRIRGVPAVFKCKQNVNLVLEDSEGKTKQKKEFSQKDAGASVLSKLTTSSVVWPSSIRLGHFLANDFVKPTGALETRKNIIELGCGDFALLSRVALHLGLWNKVVATDLKETLVRTRQIQELSRTESQLFTEVLNWKSADDVQTLLDSYPEGFELIVAADVLYSLENLWPFASVCSRLLQVNRQKLGLDSRCLVCFQKRDENVIDMFQASVLPSHGLRMEYVDAAVTEETSLKESEEQDYSLTDNHIAYTCLIEIMLDEESKNSSVGGNLEALCL